MTDTPNTHAAAPGPAGAEHHLQLARAIRGMKVGAPAGERDEGWNAAIDQVAQLVSMNPAPAPATSANIMELVDEFGRHSRGAGFSAGQHQHIDEANAVARAAETRAQIVAALAAREPLEQWLCESQRLVMRPDQPYLFRVNPTCAACAAVARGERLPAHGPTKGGE
jgi:hypothetical protein